MVREEINQVFEYLHFSDYMDKFYKNVIKYNANNPSSIITNENIMSSFFLWNSDKNFNFWCELDDDISSKFKFESTVEDFYDTLNDYLNIHPEIVL